MMVGTEPLIAEDGGLFNTCQSSVAMCAIGL
jgi:hypothetical protein